MKRGRQTFTMIEVLVAVTILTTVLGLVLLGTSTMIDSWQRIDAEARGIEDTMRVERTLDGIISNAVPFAWPDVNGDPQLQFSGERDHVFLVYRHRFNTLDDGAIRFCTLEQEGDRLVVRHRQRPTRDQVRDDDAVSELSVGVEDVEFAYADRDGDRIVWSDTWRDPLNIPLAIRVTVRWTDGRQVNWLRRTAGSGYYERLGVRRSDPALSSL